jgi:hypothetical protein
MPDQREDSRARLKARTMYGRSGRSLGAPGWLAVAESLLAEGDLGAASSALDACESRLRARARPRIARRAAWMREWTTPSSPPDVLGDTESAALTFGLLDYRTPDRTVQSRNIGDYIQSLAALGHVARHAGLEFVGDSELGAHSRALQSRIAKDDLIEGRHRTAVVVPVNRDASNYQDLPDATWTILFGWFMHPLFRQRTDFPLHPSVRPIPISFHCHVPALLTGEAVEYLRHYGPVGCRDLSTLRLLSSRGVPAFFSGCLTTTVGMGFAPASDHDGAGADRVVVVDTDAPDAPPSAARVTHHDASVMTRTLGTNLGEAAALLDFYRRDFDRMITSRLHAYLPATALGLEVDFRPRRRTDRRFDGLAPLDVGALVAMRDRISGHLARAMTAIVSGDDEGSVRAAWRDSVAPDVAAAQAMLVDE